jgi:hypothetical protein
MDECKSAIIVFYLLACHPGDLRSMMMMKRRPPHPRKPKYEDIFAYFVDQLSLTNQLKNQCDVQQNFSFNIKYVYAQHTLFLKCTREFY